MPRVPKRVKISVRGKTLGFFYTKERTYVSRRKKSVHFLWKLQAWGMNKQVFDWLEKKKCQLIRIYDTESCITYEATLSHYKTMCEVRDFGHGAQVFLSDEHWKKRQPKVRGQEELPL